MAPFEIALIVASMLPCAAWAGHTVASKALADDIERARKMCGLSQKELAIEMGITPAQLNTQLAGAEPLNAFRLYGLTSEEFRRELLSLQINRLADSGATVITNARLDTLLTRLDSFLGSAQKPMAKADLRLGQKQEAC